MVVIIYVTSLNTKEKKFARQREVLPFRHQPLRCQPAQTEPKHCGRYVSDNQISQEELGILLRFANSAFQVIPNSGSATEAAIDSATFNVLTGAVSNGQVTVNVRSDVPSATEQEIFSKEHLLMLKSIKNRLIQSLAERFAVQRRSLHITSPLQFNRLTNISHWDYSGHQITRDVYPGVSYTTVVHLGDHGKEFEFTGGRLVFIEDSPTNKSISTIEAKSGRITGYTAGKENLHYWEEVATGVNYQLVMRFTHDESAAIGTATEPWSELE